MKIRHGNLCLANLHPNFGTESGKIRPVVILQTDFLNEIDHPSTWIIPCTTYLTGGNLLRVVLPKGIAGNKETCEVMIDQSRAIDNRRFVKILKPIPPMILIEIKSKLITLGNLQS